MLRNILALVLGLAAGMAVNMGIIMLNSSLLFPMPAGTSMADPEQMNAYVASLPILALLVVMVAHLGQAFVGGFVAARLAASKPMLLAMIIGALSLLGGIMNAMSIHTPTWFYIEMPLYLLFAWTAGRIAIEQRAER